MKFPRRLLSCCLGCCTALGGLADEVRYVDSKGKQHTQLGSVVDFRGGELRIKSSAGREIKIPGDRVVAIDATWLTEHREADQRFDRHEFAEAARKYAAAFRKEQRRWVQRKLLAQVVRCQRNLGNDAEACRNFSRLADDDEETPYFDAIPLCWKVQQPSRELETLAQQWLADGPDPVRQLLAASWLLSSAARGSAIRALDRLSKHTRPQIAGLARAQGWRVQLVTVREDQLASWQRQLRALPVELRAGPYYVLGKAFARVGQTDQALLAWMRLPTMYASDHRLAQSALFESGSVLQDGEETSAAIRLYRQAIALGQDTFEGQQAQQRLADLVE